MLQPERPTGDVFLASLRRLDPDLGVVVAYGHILRPDLLMLPPRGMINVHASLLPRFRGATPIQHAILAGDTTTGVSIMRMEEGLDSGPVLLSARDPDLRRANRRRPLGRSWPASVPAALVKALGLLENGACGPSRRTRSAATYAPKIRREDARVDWHRPREATLARQVRAFDPAPGAWTMHRDAPLKLFGPTALDGHGEPGTVHSAGDRLVVATGVGVLAIREVQPAGKTRLTVDDWVRGRGITVGERLG